MGLQNSKPKPQNSPRSSRFHSSQELVASDADQKNWKGITIAILVILVILCGVALSVVLLTPDKVDDGSGGTPFEIEHVLDRKFVPRRFNGSWISGT